MDRRSFVRLLAAAPLAPALPEALPRLKVVSAYAPATVPGMPGPYPGRVVSVKSEKSVDTTSNAANDSVVREMMARGLCALTGTATAPEAWRRFFAPSDIVGIFHKQHRLVAARQRLRVGRKRLRRDRALDSGQIDRERRPYS